ncbi:hypothetical protein [Halomonas sp. E14]|uniref:hypothetical protein n=1 Tax=Halomonas sp. E14 TaxID=3397245 RepID=UPI00403ECD5B
MKTRRRLVYAGGIMLLLAGCGGDDNGDEATNGALQEPQGVEAPPPDEAEPPVAEVAPVDPLEVEVEASASLRPDRRLMVEGETNLPDGALLRIVVERELSGVRWQSRTSVQQGGFNAGPFGPGSGLPDGGYTINVLLTEANVQPAGVRERIGEQGQYLAGPLVQTSRHGLGQTIAYSHRLLIGSEPRRTSDRVEVLQVD